MPNGTVNRAAANQTFHVKPRGPRLRLNRLFVDLSPELPPVLVLLFPLSLELSPPFIHDRLSKGQQGSVTANGALKFARFGDDVIAHCGIIAEF